MRLLRPSCGRALLCVFLLSTLTAGAVDHGKRQETSLSSGPTPTDNGESTIPVPTLSASIEDITARPSSTHSDHLSSSTHTPPSSTDNATALFNGT
jgi:hypothetical protein